MSSTDWVAVYRESAYAFATAEGEWCEFILNESPGPPAGAVADAIKAAGSVCLITAWNPMSEECPLAENQQANLDLSLALETAGIPFAEAYGSSLPGVSPSWREDGFALFGLSQDQAAEWGRRMEQRALVWLNPEHVGLLFCDPPSFIECGLMVKM